ncbi:caspase family protein [Pseudooceanicola onchidii]|uniref:caspase family protein n=1 Tax=Pseudooceanicola onchidii TaxID=2562279 RepID=UPI00145C1202|nr:caspase family protein [Pseudooceanicola onchidii]
MTLIRSLLALVLIALTTPVMAQAVLFKNFSEVQVTGPIARELSGDNHALIIYNSEYEHDGISDLPVTENDAKAIQKLFEGMGYPTQNIKVIANGDKDTLEEQVLFFASTLTRDSSVVVYYSGHGISFDDDPSNYVVPVDMNPEVSAPNAAAKELLFKRRSVNFNKDVLGIIKSAGPKGVVVFYDACRNSPVTAGDGTKSVGRSDSFVPAKIEGTAMFYSASSGQTSLASLGPQDDVHLSLYTRVLVSQLSSNPSIRLSDLHSQVQGEVTTMARTRAGGHSQKPVYEDKLDYSNSENKEFCLASVMVNGVPRCTGREGLKVASGGGDLPEGFCENAPVQATLAGITDLTQLRADRDTYFRCTALRTAIDARIATLNWDSTTATNSCDAYRSYLRNFPGSVHAATAQAREAEACRVLSPAELAHHIGICESVYRNFSFGNTNIPAADLAAATESCKAASNARPTDYELGFKRAELLLATGQQTDWQQAVELLSNAAISDYPKAAIRLGDYYSSDNAGFLTRDLNQALTWYERATKMQRIAAPDMVASLYRIAALYDELGSAHLATDAYRRIVQIERSPRALLDHARSIPEGQAGRVQPDDVYDLVFTKWNDGDTAFQIGEAWEAGAHGGPNLKKAQQWYERAQKLGNAAAGSKIAQVSTSGSTGGDGSYDALLACIDEAERQLRPQSRQEDTVNCLQTYLSRASMTDPYRAEVEEYLADLTASTPVAATPAAHPAARFNGSYSGWRGYTDGGRRSPSKECLNRYSFTAEITDGQIRFWSDGRTFTGSVDANGFVSIDRTGLSPRSKTPFTIDGPLTEAHMYSGYCGNGYFRLQM